MLIWLLLGAEMLFLLLPRTVLDLRAISFFLTLKDQPATVGLNVGISILVVMLLIEAYSLIALWWLALRCNSSTIDELPAFIGIGAAFGVVSMLNFVLPIIWALVAIPLFSIAGIMGKLQFAPLIVTATAFAVMYWRSKMVQTVAAESPALQQVGSLTSGKSPARGNKFQYILVGLGIAAGFFLFGESKPQPPLTLEQVKSLNFRVSVKGAPFNTPVNYHYTDYSYFKKWPRPTQGEIDKVERRAVDYIKVTALLPDMAPYTVENAAEYEKPGWGKKIKMMLGQEKNLDLSYISKLEKIENPSLPGMLQYESGLRGSDTYISKDYLIKIRCNNEPKKINTHPYCEVLRPYHYKPKPINSDVGIPVFHIRYTFSRDYLQQWRVIDEQVQALFDRFAASAQQN